DADLSAGLINETDARARRKHLEDESAFFGAMDGASKFVRGDAIAGLLVVFINVIGGMIIGIAQQGMPFSEAARTYTLPTVGAGAGGLAYLIEKRARLAAAAEASKTTTAAKAEPADEPISTALKIDDLKIELGYALLPLVNAPDGSDRLTEQIKALRRSLAGE